MQHRSYLRRGFVPVLVGLLLVALAPEAAAKVSYKRILFLGNSITLHRPKPDIGWTGKWGMAASSEEKDFVHLVARALSPPSGPAPAIMAKNIAEFERNFATYDVQAKLKEAFAFRPDLVVLAVGENVPNMGTDQAQSQFADGLRRLLQGLEADGRPKIVVRSCFWANKIKDQILRQACQDAGGTFVDIGSLGKDEANYARSERKFAHAGVAAHPGDRGMQAIANAILGAIIGQQDCPSVTAWPAPPGEVLSEDYHLKVSGRAVPVYACRVSAVPFNQDWPGYQRPLDQTEVGGLACWDMRGAVEVEVELGRAPKSVVLRPASRKIVARIEGNRVSFSLDRPGPVIVEVEGPQRALHLFASPPEKDVPAPGAPGVRYFGPGVHRPGKIELTSHQTVYLAGGAVVYGAIHAKDATNIRLAGRGILDVSTFERGKGGGAVRLTNCSAATIEGIVMRDPDVWCCSLFGCRQVTISNVKLVGLWRYNADGIDVCNSQEVDVSDSFVRAYDDALVVKGLESALHARPVRNVRFTRCVVWCDWGRAMQIGAETRAPEIAEVVFDDCDIVRTTHSAMDIQHRDRAAISNIRFQNIRLEIDQRNPRPRLQKAAGEVFPGNAQEEYTPKLMEIIIRKTAYSKDEDRGTVRAVLFKDIEVLSPVEPSSSLRGADAEHSVDGVTIENLRFNGRLARDPAAARLTIGPHARNVHFIE